MLFNLLEQDWFITILTALATAVAAGLTTLIGLGFNKLAKWLEQKGISEKHARILTQVKDLIQDSVLTIQQTFVEQLKKDGKFTPENQKEALNKAVELVIENLTTEAEEVLREIYGDFNKWLTIQIEAIIATILPHGKDKENKTIKGQQYYYIETEVALR